jgi:hypothetical protein
MPHKFLYLFLILTVPVSSSATGMWSDCISGKYGNYAQAQERLQRGLSKLITDVEPRYADVARMYMTIQLHGIEMALLAVKYLAQHEPTKLRTNMPINNWLNLDEGERQLIARRNKRFAELMRVEEENMKRPPHPDGDGLRLLMREKILKLPAYRHLLETFSQSVKNIENIQCEK